MEFGSIASNHSLLWYPFGQVRSISAMFIRVNSEEGLSSNSGVFLTPEEDNPLYSRVQDYVRRREPIRQSHNPFHARAE